jgi:hypothetical protein
MFGNGFDKAHAVMRMLDLHSHVQFLNLHNLSREKLVRLAKTTGA